MRAAVLKQYGAPLIVKAVDDPALNPDDVLVRVRACSLCGSDLKIASGKFPGTPLPHIPGHEIAGEVYKVGNQVTEFSIGDHVVVYFYITCGVCRYCKSGNDSLCENLKGHIGFNVNGGMAEFLKVPSSCLIPFKSDISFTDAALMPDAIATSYHALRTKGNLQKGEVAVVVGVGGLGLHAVQIAKVLGATVVAVDVDDLHLKKASELGADVVLNSNRDNISEAIRMQNTGKGADVVMDLVGQPKLLEDEISYLCPTGRLLVVGYDLTTAPFSIHAAIMVLTEIKIIGCRATNRNDLAEVVKLVEAGKIKPVVSDILPLTDVNKAYQVLREGKVTGRVVLEI